VSPGDALTIDVGQQARAAPPGALGVAQRGSGGNDGTVWHRARRGIFVVLDTTSGAYAYLRWPAVAAAPRDHRLGCRQRRQRRPVAHCGGNGSGTDGCQYGGYGGGAGTHGPYHGVGGQEASTERPSRSCGTQGAPVATSPSPTAPTALVPRGQRRAGPHQDLGSAGAVVAVAAGTAAAAEVAATTTSSPATAEVVAGARTMSSRWSLASSATVASTDSFAQVDGMVNFAAVPHGRPGGGAVPERGGQCQPGRPSVSTSCDLSAAALDAPAWPRVELQRAGVIPAGDRPRRSPRPPALRSLRARWDQGRPRLAARSADFGAPVTWTAQLTDSPSADFSGGTLSFVATNSAGTPLTLCSTNTVPASGQVSCTRPPWPPAPTR